MKFMLSGIMLALISLFLMGICILGGISGFYPDVLSFVVMIIAIIVFVMGFFDE